MQADLAVPPATYSFQLLDHRLCHISLCSLCSDQRKQVAQFTGPNVLITQRCCAETPPGWRRNAGLSPLLNNRSWEENEKKQQFPEVRRK